jgi:hypothetical protein
VTEPAIAYLVLAHHQPNHLRRLVGALRSPRCCFYVHVDAKTDIAPFRGLDRDAPVVLLEDRERVFWGGFSQVQATLNLLAAATRAGAPFRRYCLLSGADYPIRPREEIEEILLGSPREFIALWQPLLTGDRRRDQYAFFVTHRHFLDFRWLNPKADVPLPALRDGAVRILDLVNRILPPRGTPAGLALHKGSQWWCLSDEAIGHVRGFMERNRDIVSFFRRTFAADETFFQSIVAARAPERAFRVPQNLRGAHAAHYLDWSDPTAYSPKTLDESDLERLRDSGALFARKFDETRSARLLELIDDSLLRPGRPRPPAAC